MSDYVIVLTTLGVDADAEALARTLVEERLAACVNLLPEMTSVYRWDGGVQQDRERQLVVKTAALRLDALRERLLALHPYQVPEFLVLEVAGGSEAYLGWVRDATS
ncbi:MAG TPA: divalent-cation tolerance protein CutA [Methylomirabilota bacterium]